MENNKKYIAVISLVTLALFVLSILTAAISVGGAVELDGNSVEPVEDCAALPEEERVNILVGGSDRATGLTDVIMLVSVDTKNKKASVMQIPRDTYAAYTDKSYKKLNGAYGALGGAEALCAMLSDSLGVPIHRYLMLSPDALCGAVDALGGVEVNIRKPMYYRDPAQGLYISLKAGKQTLDGKKAEQFIRYRSGYADGDLGRIDTQKVFLCAFARRVKENMTPASLAGLISALLGNTDTNITLSDARMLSDAFISIENEDMLFVTAPGSAVIAKKSGASYYVLSSKAMSEVLSAYFGASGGFDGDNIFLNPDYDDFRKIYFGYSEYRVTSSAEISEDTDGIAGIT